MLLRHAARPGTAWPAGDGDRRRCWCPRRGHAAPASAGPADPALIDDLVVANHILFDQGVVDGFGHISVRHNKDPNRYLLSRSMAPALVAADDIMEFDLDSTPVDPRGRTAYLERFIHGEIYKVRPDVVAIVHSHSPSVIPFADTKIALRPMNHIAGFLGTARRCSTSAPPAARPPTC